MVWLIVAAVAVLFALLSVFIYFESRGFVTENYSFDSERSGEDFGFVFFSDLHETCFGENNAELLRAIDECGCDYVFIGGDVITSKCDFSPEFDTTIEFLKQLCARRKVIFAYGNHERALCDIRDCEAQYRKGKKDDSDIKRIDVLEKSLIDSGAILLRDDHYDIPGTDIRVFGLDLSLDYFRRLVRRKPEDGYIDSLLGPCDKEKFSILMAHDPEHIKEYADWGCNLVLAGHLHGGIVRVPGLGGVISPQIRIFPKYDSGVFKVGRTDMLLTRGIGTHTIPIRVFNKAEICKVTIHYKKTESKDESKC